ncbi:MAG: helix-turn-helix domain-containing protein [Candidatus Choladocola sp.]|nr:helix-turn-helix domain-containing protein [Candidatus Choladocola sp.]
MDVQKEIKLLREGMNMNRREFCDYFDIPYRTVTDWEAGKRAMPEYVMRLMEYKARAEKMLVKESGEDII